MSTRHTVVVGLGFGDEGKGATVDYLCRQTQPRGYECHRPVVVRYNGGAQAAHNVHTPDGRHHTFAQFGSGTLAGASTFLSRYMVVNPLNMMREAIHLETLGIEPWSTIAVDPLATVVTPWQRAVGRLREDARGENRLGSTGQGIGEAVGDALAGLRVTVRDCATSALLIDRLTEIRHRKGLAALALTADGGVPEQHPWPSVTEVADAYRAWAELVDIREGQSYLYGRVRAGHSLIFEGAQGLLLDQDHGIGAPDYATWSDCTTANAHTLLGELDIDTPVKTIGVMRTYMTRHGAGPFPTESPWVNHPEPDNGTGRYQGHWRQGYLDLSNLRYALEVNGGVDELAVTHVDRLDGDWNIRVEEGFEPLEIVPHHRVLDAIENNLSTAIGLLSYGPTAADRKRA
jgi:adenylosuccinate synthase